MSTVTKRPATTLPGEQVVGYVHLGEGDPLRLPELASEVKAFATQHSLMLGTLFTESQHGLQPALKRPALRALLDVVRYLHPSGVVVPTTWHLSSSEVEPTSLLRRLAGFNCRVFTTQASKAAVAMRDRLLEDLTGLWEAAVAARRELSPGSPVEALDRILRAVD